jgi:putative CocE/NonD family hydrolase
MAIAPPANARQPRLLLPGLLLSLALASLPLAHAADSPPTLSGKPLPKWFKFYPAEHEVAIDRTFIAMPDGVKLAVTYYKPADASPQKKYPIILNMVPYRKDDLFYAGDYGMYCYLAARGIACARIDIRGTGGSEGVEVDREYSDAELDDLEFCIGSMAALPWCNGRIGMQGKSWAGFNALMMAMRQPPALKALLVAHASEDLYANDVHNWDGVLHLDIFTEEIETESLMPRSPDYVLDKDYFTNRFDREPWIFTYLRHQRDGKFWRDGRSLFTAYDRVKIPVYAIGGLLDGYRDFAVSILDHVKSPVKAEFGPWNHAWPNSGSPGPAYDNWQTAVRWWKQWLCDEETGIMREPKVIAFVRGTVPASDDYETAPGSYQGFGWPLDGVKPESLQLSAPDSLVADAAKAATLEIPVDPAAGIDAGSWWGERAPDMRHATAGSLVFDSAPLTAPKVIAGQPHMHLHVAAEAPLANWSVCLEDVHPDGAVTLITGGSFNGSQRDSRTDPKPLEPGKFFDADFPLHFTTYTFAKGHRIRITVSNAQFPMLWPTPYRKPTQLAVGASASTLALPVLTAPGAPADFLLKPVDMPVPSDFTLYSGAALGDAPPPKVSHEGKWVKVLQDEEQHWKIRNTEFYDYESVTYRVDPSNPAVAGFLGAGRVTIDHEGRKLEIVTSVDVESDAKDFAIKVHRKLTENGIQKGEKTWTGKIPRDFQ